MRNSGFIIVILFFSIFSGIGITRTQGLTEVIYEGDWVINTNTEILETDKNITVTGNLIIFFTVQLISHSQINVLGDVIMNPGGPWPTFASVIFQHYAPLNVYGNLYISQRMISYGDVFVNNSIIIDEGELNLENDITIRTKNLNLTSTSRILNNVQAGFGANTTIITENLIIEEGSILILRGNSRTLVGENVDVRSDSSLQLESATLNIGGIFNISAEVKIIDSMVSIDQSLYTDDLGLSPNAESLYVDNSTINISNSVVINRYVNILNSKITQTNSQFAGHFIESYAYSSFIRTELISHSSQFYNENSSLVIRDSSIKYDGDGNTITSKNSMPNYKLVVSGSALINPAIIHSEGNFAFVENTNFDTQLFTTGSSGINQNTGDLIISVKNINNTGVLQLLENKISGNVSLENIYPDTPIEFQGNSLTHLSLDNVTNLNLSDNTFSGSNFRDVVSAEIYNNTFLGTVSFEGKSHSNIIESNSFVDVTSSGFIISNTTVKDNTFAGKVSGINLILLPELIHPGVVLDLSDLDIQLSYSFDGSTKVNGATKIVFPDTIGIYVLWLDVSLGSNSFVGSFMIEVVEEPVTIPSSIDNTEKTPLSDESPSVLYSSIWYLIPIISLVLIRKK